MKSIIKISENLELPLDVVTQSLAILARKRAGKSYTGRRFAEELLDANQQVVILDPKGDWWGIRSGANGKTPGFPVVVLGGEHGDLPLEKNAAETIARLIVEERVSVLLDLSDLRKYEIPIFLGGDLKRGGEGLLELLYRMKAKEEFRTPLMLIVDEADAIAPQKPNPGEERMLGAMDDIVRRGGQRGIGCLLISQRSAVVNKNVLTQTQVMIAMQTIARLDMDAIMDWVDVHGQVEQGKVLRASLPSLPTGDAWILSPGWPTKNGIFERIHVDRIKTFDSGATPKAGEKRIKPKNLADVDMDALQRRMAETIEKAKAEDPKELRKQIAELKAQLAKQPAAVAPVEKIKLVEVPALKEAAIRRLEQVTGSLNKLGSSLTMIADEIVSNIRKTHSSAEVTTSAAVALRQAAASRPAPPRGEAASLSGDLPSRPQQAIINSLAWLEAIGIERAARTIVGFLADASPKSSAFTNNLGALRTRGLIDYPSSGEVALTIAGRAAAAQVEAPPTSKRLHEMIYARLPRPQSAILQQLIRVYPNSLDRQQLADLAGASASSSAFTNNLGALRSIGLIDYPDKGHVIARKLLFLENDL